MESQDGFARAGAHSSIEEPARFKKQHRADAIRPVPHLRGISTL